MKILPNAGEVGPFEAEMFRGIRPECDRLHADFASDPGDYGCGEYWTDSMEGARVYGEVIARTVRLDRVYHIPREELRRLIEEYRTCRVEDGHVARLANVGRLTKFFLSKGYQAVITRGYESFDETAICIFQDQPGKAPEPTSGIVTSRAGGPARS